MNSNYFTCTLDQAGQYQQGKCWTTIHDFIAYKARQDPDLPVVGFCLPGQDEEQGNTYRQEKDNLRQHWLWRSQVWTFRNILDGSAIVAQTLSESERFQANLKPGQPVALLSPSSTGFLLTWLALIQLGHPVLLVAPQCAASAIALLCRSCGVSRLLYDAKYRQLAEDANGYQDLGMAEKAEMAKQKTQSMTLSSSSSTAQDDHFGLVLTTMPMPCDDDGEEIFDHAVRRRSMDRTGTARTCLTTSANLKVKVKDTDIAYLHHTSGTSSGIPKPIPQSHHAAVGVLPILDGRRQATFTTTPLYHGGIADLFRAWTSNALIWLFPGGELPITAANICKCLEVAADNANANFNDTVAAAITATEVAEHWFPPVKYFSSVPYVLQMMADDEQGLRHLREMDIVGVGGAALPKEVGDRLVKEAVNLVSRFGSAECGFLMSSHRPFDSDQEWQYLRYTPAKREGRHQPFLKFEPRQDGAHLHELVVRPSWPHMAKRNREDGSYATSDLFVPHPVIPNAWRYESRADSQLTLLTGKKFDPAPLEDSIRASSDLIGDVLIFGNGKPYPGILLFRSPSPEAATISDANLIAQVVPMMEKWNNDSQSHARISRNMIVPVPYVEEVGGSLEKSSKGTVLRARAEERYVHHITAAYQSQHQHQQILPTGAGAFGAHDIPSAIRNIVISVLGGLRASPTGAPQSGTVPGTGSGCELLTDNTDLFTYGVDSVASMQIRQALDQLILPNLNSNSNSNSRRPVLPLTVVEDAGTITRLSEWVEELRATEHDIREQQHKPQQTSKLEQGQGQEQTMLDLVKEYSNDFNSSPDDPQSHPHSHPQSSHCPCLSRSHKTDPYHDQGIHVLLTGPTGSLGSHILHQMLADSRVSKIYLLVRGATRDAARERILKALKTRRLPVPSNLLDSKTVILPCNLCEPGLGLSQTEYDSLSRRVNVIMHLAWNVNFLLPLRSFVRTHLVCLKSLLKLAITAARQPRFVFCSSVAAVSNYCTSNHHQPDRQHQHLQHTTLTSSVDPPKPNHNIPEHCLRDCPSVAGGTGYARSKWVAEAICAVAHDSTSLRDRLSIARVGQLSGASDTGVWSKSEAYPLMLASANATGVLPDLKNETLNWLPVDVAARAILENALRESEADRIDLPVSASSTSVIRPGPTAVGSNRTEPGLSNNIDTGPPVHHILNPDNSVQWSDLLVWVLRHETQMGKKSSLKSADVSGIYTTGPWTELEAAPRPQLESGSVSFKIVSVDEWLSRLAALQDLDITTHHPALKLLGFWTIAYGRQSNRGENESESRDLGTSHRNCTSNLWDGSHGDVESSRRTMGPGLTSEESIKAKAETKPSSRFYGSSDETLESFGPGPNNEALENRGTQKQARTQIPMATQYEMTRTYTRMPSLQRATHHTNAVIDETYVLKLWEWIKHNV